MLKKLLVFYRKLRSFFMLFKSKLLRRDLEIGFGTTFRGKVHVSRKNKIVIGNNCYFGPNVYFGSNVNIKNDVLVGPNVSFVGGDHKIDGIKSPIIRSGRDVMKTTNIDDNVWIGFGAIVLHGVSISTGSVIAAGSVLTKDTGVNEIWGGNPAKLIRKRL